MKYILLTVPNSFIRKSLFQEGFFLKKCLNVKCELVMGDGEIQEDCQMYEWMALVRIVKCAVPMHVG